MRAARQLLHRHGLAPNAAPCREPVEFAILIPKPPRGLRDLPLVQRIKKLTAPLLRTVVGHPHGAERRGARLQRVLHVAFKAGGAHPRRCLRIGTARQLPIEPGDALRVHLGAEILQGVAFDFQHRAAVAAGRNLAHDAFREVRGDPKSPLGQRLDEPPTRERFCALHVRLDVVGRAHALG